MDEDILNLIVSSEHTANPLYLKALLEELRVFGIHEKLKEYITGYLKAQTIAELYQKILARYETDYNRERPGLVRDAMSLIWAARRGLSEAELMDLLGTGDEPLQSAYWSPLYLAAEHALVSRSGLISFFHDYLRQAVQRRYLKTETERKQAHLKIADYFKERELNHRKVDELPWQLGQANSWNQLYGFLSELSFFEFSWKNDEFEVKKYWKLIEDNTKYQINEAYKSVLENPYQFLPFAEPIARLLEETRYPSEALELRYKLIDFYRQKDDKLWLTTMLINTGLILLNTDDLNNAMNHFKESESIAREENNLSTLATSLLNQAVILSRLGKIDRSFDIYKEAELIYRNISEKKGLAQCLLNQGSTLLKRGELERVTSLLLQAEKIYKDLGDKEGLSECYTKHGLLHEKSQNYNDALEFYKKAEIIYKKIGNLRYLQQCLNLQGLVHRTIGNLTDAMVLFKRAEEICLKISDKKGLAECLGNQGPILRDKGELEKAISLHIKEERIFRELGNPTSLQVSLINHGIALALQRKNDEAIEKFKEAELICRKLDLPEGLAQSLSNQAVSLSKNKGNPIGCYYY